MTQELSDFALGFVKGCANKNMTVDQMLKAAMQASDNIPGVKSELQPLLTMDKEAGKWNPKNVWGGAKKVWQGMKDIPGWFSSKFNKNIDDVPTPAPPARDLTFSDPTPALPVRDPTFSDVPEPPEHLQEMLRLPKKPAGFDPNELNATPGRPVAGNSPDMRSAEDIEDQKAFIMKYIEDMRQARRQAAKAGARQTSPETPRNIFLPDASGTVRGDLPADATRAAQWDWLRGLDPRTGIERSIQRGDTFGPFHRTGRASLPGIDQHIRQDIPLEIDMQNYYKGREEWHLDHYDRGAEQVRALNKSGDPNAAEVMDWTPRQEAMVTQLHREHGTPVLDVLRQQWDDAAASAVSSGRRMDPGDVPPEVAEHMYYRNVDNRARQADLQADMDDVYEQLKLKDPDEAEAYRKMQRMFKKLREAGITPPANRSDLLIPPPSSHPQVQMPPYGKQGMANVKLALDMFRDGRSLNAQQ